MKRCVVFHAACCVGLLSVFAAATQAAVDRVICIPWQGNVNSHHTTYSGYNLEIKGVIKTTSTGTIWYKWVFGDGSESSVSSLSGKTRYNVETRHVYTGAVDTPFTARLQVDDVDNSMAHAREDTYLIKVQANNLDARVNMAIDRGLWYLYKQGANTSSSWHTFDGSPFMVWSYGTYSVFSSPTACAVHAFEINGHKETGNFNEDPYAEYVQLGLNWLFNGYYANNSYPMLRAVTMTLQNGNLPDTNGNGIGISARDYGYNEVYQSGMVMDAIIASGTPDADSGRDFDGDGSTDTYREVLQDMCDMYAWGMNDTGTYRGGWRYTWNAGTSDNSISQWAAIGMIPAQEPPWNCTVPDWVKSLNNTAWLWYSFNPSVSSNPAWGGFGYTGAAPTWGHYAVTPSGMIQLSFSGSTTADSRWVRCERWLADNWNYWLTGYSNNIVYAYFGLAKAMRLAKPNPVERFSSNNFDWYRGGVVGGATLMGLAEKISTRLLADGYWDHYGVNLGTAWCVITLRPVLFREGPIACFDADPNPAYPDRPVEFDPTCSGHSAPGKTIANLVKFEWDWDNNGTYDESTTGPDTVTHSFSTPTVPVAFPVKLRVTDDAGDTATFAMDIRVTNPPHPPVSKAGGPYWVSLCDEDALTLRGSQSYDPDEGEHEAGCPTCPPDTITAYEWDLTSTQWNYTDKTGVTVDLGTGFRTYFPSAGIYDIGLRVTDNTEASYPNSGEPDLTDEGFSQVEVFNGAMCDITAVPQCLAVQLSWGAVEGAERYDIYRSVTDKNTGFQYIGFTDTNSKTAGSFTMGVTHWYRIMAIRGEEKFLSKAAEVYGDPHLCDPTADAGGPYDACVGEAMTLDGSGSTPLAGVIILWEWDLDNDGVFDDAFGETVQVTWNTPGTHTIGLKVTSSDSLVLTNTDLTTVTVTDCHCVDNLAARSKSGKIQLTWTHTGDAKYNVYRGTLSGGPYLKIASVVTTYCTYLDAAVVNGTTYYYVVRPVNNDIERCQSNEASAKALAR